MVASILFIAIGIVAIFIAIKGLFNNNKVTYITGVFFILLGILILIAIYLNNDFILACVLGISGGSVFFAVPIYNVYCIFNCNKSINGMFLGSNQYRGRSAPIFSYKYENKVYKTQSQQIFAKRKVDKKYKKGREYKVYINEKNPNVVIVTKRIGFGDILMFIMGTLCMCVPILI